MQRLLLATLLGGLTLAASLPARAVGTRVDVQVVDRTTGESLPVYSHDGEWWVAGRPGAKYRVTLSSRDGRRTLNVLSIDGVNAITGDTAAWDQTGYVIAPYRHYGIDGWRKNMSEVAAFEFADLPDSYAARTGRPANVGVIGVAVFDEKPAPPPPQPIARVTEPERARAESSAPGFPAQKAPAPPAPTSSAPPPATDGANDRAAGKFGAPSSLIAQQRLGTGHGEIEQSSIRYVDFKRARETPDEIVTIHYDRMENLVAMGIVARPIAPIATNPPVDPFPDSHRYVPDPPSRR
jgi:hypothetical protein